MSNCPDLIVIIQNGGTTAWTEFPQDYFHTPTRPSFEESFLGAEVRAVESLLSALDPTTVAVGLVTSAAAADWWRFSVYVHGGPVVVVPLTYDYNAVRSGLSRISQQKASGADDLAGGLNQSVTEILGLKGAISATTGGGRRAILILTNGHVSLPYGPGFEADNRKAVKRAADRARSAGIHLYAYLLPWYPKDQVEWLTEVTDATGSLTVVRSPANFVEAVSRFSVPEN